MFTVVAGVIHGVVYTKLLIWLRSLEMAALVVWPVVLVWPVVWFVAWMIGGQFILRRHGWQHPFPITLAAGAATLLVPILLFLLPPGVLHILGYVLSGGVCLSVILLLGKSTKLWQRAIIYVIAGLIPVGAIALRFSLSDVVQERAIQSQVSEVWFPTDPQLKNAIVEVEDNTLASDRYNFIRMTAAATGAIYEYKASRNTANAHCPSDVGTNGKELGKQASDCTLVGEVRPGVTAYATESYMYAVMGDTLVVHAGSISTEEKLTLLKTFKKIPISQIGRTVKANKQKVDKARAAWREYYTATYLQPVSPQGWKVYAKKVSAADPEHPSLAMTFESGPRDEYGRSDYIYFKTGPLSDSFAPPEHCTFDLDNQDEACQPIEGTPFYRDKYGSIYVVIGDAIGIVYDLSAEVPYDDLLLIAQAIKEVPASAYDGAQTETYATY